MKVLLVAEGRQAQERLVDGFFDVLSAQLHVAQPHELRRMEPATLAGFDLVVVDPAALLQTLAGTRRALVSA